MKNPMNSEWFITKEALDNMKEEVYNIDAKGNNRTEREVAVFSKYFFSSPVFKTNGTAIISVNGVLYENDYKTISTQVEKAENDKDIKNIVLDINSPGGQVAGVFEACNTIRNCSKPVASFTSTNMCSAAYAIGCSASNMYATKHSQIGSIGVMLEYADFSEIEKKMGIKTVIFKGKYSEKKNLDPESKEGKEKLQARIDKAEEFLHEHIASSRGISMQDVLDKFGHGEVFYAEDAKERGMVDALVDDFDECMSLLEDSTQQVGGEESYMSLEELKKADPVAYDKLMEEAKMSAKEDKDVIIAQAQKAERERITAINSFEKLSAIEGISDILAQAKASGESVNDVKIKAFDTILANYKAPVAKEEDNTPNANQKVLDAIAQESSENTPNVGGKDDPTKPLTEQEKASADADAILASLNPEEVK